MGVGTVMMSAEFHITSALSRFGWKPSRTGGQAPAQAGKRSATPHTPSSSTGWLPPRQQPRTVTNAIGCTYDLLYRLQRADKK